MKRLHRIKLLIAVLTSALLLLMGQNACRSPGENESNQQTNGESRTYSLEHTNIDKIVIARSGEEEVLAKSNRIRRPKSETRAGASQRTRLSNYTITNDINYAGDENPRHTLLLAVPSNSSDEPVPLLVFIHGGGWRSGNKKVGLRKLSPFLNGTMVGASINYRLSDEAQWPAQIHDCKAAVRWLRAHAEEYNIDPERIGVYGNSAGGHLALMLGVSSGSPLHEGKIGEHIDQPSSVSCVIDGFGPADFLTMGKTPRKDHDSPGSAISLLVGGPVQERKEVARSASPLAYVGADSSPTLILHGSEDPLVPFEQSHVLAEELKKHGVECFLVKVEGGKHGFPINDELKKRVTQFLTRYLLGGEVPSPLEEPVRVILRSR